MQRCPMLSTMHTFLRTFPAVRFRIRQECREEYLHPLGKSFHFHSYNLQPVLGPYSSKFHHNSGTTDVRKLRFFLITLKKNWVHCEVRFLHCTAFRSRNEREVSLMIICVGKEERESIQAVVTWVEWKFLWQRKKNKNKTNEIIRALIWVEGMKKSCMFLQVHSLEIFQLHALKGSYVHSHIPVCRYVLNGRHFFAA